MTGRLNPHPLITERVGVLVSGLLIAQPVLRDTALLGADNGLMVHDVEPGSVGDDLEFDYWDILTAIGGKHYVDVQALYEDLKNAGESLTIEVLRISDSDAALFEYVRLQLPIEDLELIAGQ